MSDDLRSIREKKKGVWEVRAFVSRDPLTGRTRHVSRSITGTAAAARKLRSKLEAEVAEGKHGGTAGTLGMLFDEWNAYREGMGAAKTTLAEDRRKIDKDIRPVLGSKPLDRLGSRDLDRFYVACRAKGKGDRTVLTYHRIIHAALQQALVWGWVPSNVAGVVKAPKAVYKPMRVPEPEEVRALIAEARKSRNPEMAGLITVAALSGMRDGEICGLRFSAINLDECIITVRLSVWQVGKHWDMKLPKSNQVRSFKLDPDGIDIIRNRYDKLIESASLIEVEVPEDGFVWSRDPLGQVPYLPHAVSQAFIRIRDRAGVDCRFHGMASPRPFVRDGPPWTGWRSRVGSASWTSTRILRWISSIPSTNAGSPAPYTSALVTNSEVSSSTTSTRLTGTSLSRARTM